jgi:2-oxoglutarate dehydrogenase complex dihydrolipoamide succinyltransferase (E2) component
VEIGEIMLVDIIMPKMGESIMDGRILKWHKKVGENIAKDETLFEISTDKVDTEVPSSEGGVIVELLFNEGDTANVEDVVARIETDPSKAKLVKTSPVLSKGEGKKEATTNSTTDKQELATVEAKVKDVGQDSHFRGNDFTTGFYSPLVMNIASKEGVSMEELSKINGTGIGGRIRKQDILAYVEARKSKPSAKIPSAKEKTSEFKPAKEFEKSPELTALYKMPGVEVIPMDNLQEKMAEHMVKSVHTSPHVGAIAECDMTAVEKAKKSLESEFIKKEGFKLTYMPFICEAVVKALKDFPLVNSSIDGNNILRKSFINIGIAVAMEKGGLIVPVIKNADSKNLVGFARDINDLAKRARIKKLSLDEIQDGTFTITNYGIFGNIIGTPIINQPQLAILGTGAIKKRAVVVDTPDGDAIVIKPIMYLTLSFDHRLVDGALGGKFLMKIVEYIENYQI